MTNIEPTETPNEGARSYARAYDPGRSRYSTTAAYLTLTWLLASVIALATGIALVSRDIVSDRNLLLAVIFAGGGGAALQATTAVTAYIGTRTFSRSWAVYFFVRPLVGAGLALLIYVTLRAGLLDSDAPVENLNHYGVLGVALLCGLFSRTVLQRMTELSDLLLLDRPGGVTSISKSTLPPTPVRSLDPYSGYIIRELVEDQRRDTRLLRVWLQSSPHDFLPSTRIDVGEGVPRRKTAFRVSVLPEEGEVEPRSAELVANSEEARTEPCEFIISMPVGVEVPSGFIEVSQHGKTVAVLPIHDPHT